MRVDNSICLHCGLCVGICPPNALFLYETRTIEFLPACTECGLCAKACPVGAISEEAEMQVPLAEEPMAAGSR